MKTATESPSFCSLPPDAFAERVAMIRNEILPRADATERLSDGRAWTFANGSELRAELEHLVALERECCGAQVRFELEERGETLRLAVHGVDPDAAVFSSIGADAVTESASAAGGGKTGVVKAGGLGLLLSFGLFCGVPLALTAWFGAAVAAPFVGLDHPAVVVLGAVLAAALLAWLHRLPYQKTAEEKLQEALDHQSAVTT